MQPLTVCSWMFTVWMIQLALVVLTIQAQDCTKPTGGSNMVLSDAYINQDTFPNGQQVTFKCSIGYTSAEGSAKITCNAGGWSQLYLKCKPKSCGPPGEIDNGQFDLSEGISFGATVTAICNPGYFIVGSDTRMCLDAGWSGRVPVCEVVKCGPPPRIINGGPESPPEEEYKYQDVVVYGCDKDFTMNGTNSIMCSESGKFEPSPPQCLKVLCKTPSVENGYRSGGGPPPYRYRSYVTFACNTGYQLEGEASLTCGINSTWSHDYPTCEAIRPTPKPPTTSTTTTTTTTKRDTTKEEREANPTDSPDEPKDEPRESNTWKIVLGVVAGLVGCLTGIIGFVIYKKSTRFRGLVSVLVGFVEVRGLGHLVIQKKYSHDDQCFWVTALDVATREMWPLKPVKKGCSWSLQPCAKSSS
ncbi:hypothetical protein UPYG_G00003320 [Umbra pygmaea]|uniref:Sushi domain-containing protein n=1 Tax=Umbra pygmaea TaxID=75934 RepID=A0ABD0XY60_UMBPY